MVVIYETRHKAINIVNTLNSISEKAIYEVAIIDSGWFARRTK